MGKYWKTSLISFVIVLTVGTLYFQVAKANKMDVAIQIETTSGNEDEIENLQLQGYYYEDENALGHSFNLTKDGATELSYPSFTETLMTPPGSPLMKEYTKKYRSFMRGKEMNELKFFEDENRIIYVDFDDEERKTIQGNPLTLKIDILDKTNDNPSSFEVVLLAQASYEWINIEDVYVENGKIKVFTKGYLLNYEGEEFRVFTIDENKKDVQQKLIISKVEDKMTSNNISQLLNKQSLQNIDYSVYMESHFIPKPDSPYDEQELVPDKLIIFNNSTDEVKEWLVPDELKPYVNGIVFHHSSLIVVVPSEASLDIHRYQIEQNQWESPVKLDNANLSGEETLSVRQMDDKLYVFNQYSNNNIVAIIDLTTDKVLYEGKIIVEKDGKRVSDYNLSIYELYYVE